MTKRQKDNLEEIYTRNFGIHTINRMSANGTFHGGFTVIGNYSGISFVVISDGKVEYYTKNPDSCFTIQELLDWSYRGEIHAKVQGATWTVVCTDGEDGLGCRIYSDEQNFYSLGPTLERCLKKLGYRHFTDALEDIEPDFEMMAVFSKRP